MCNEFHARWGPYNTYLLCSVCYEVHVYRVLVCRVPFAPSSCVMNPMIAGFQLRWIPCVSGSMIVGLHLLWVLLRLVLALRLSFVMNPMHAGLYEFHACRVHVLRASIGGS